MSYDDTYEFLKKVDKGIASDYLSTKAKNKALQDILDEVRLLLDVGHGQSILEAVRANVGPATLEPVETQIIRTTDRQRSVVSKQEREDVKRRLLALGATFSPKDSSKRLLTLLKKVEGKKGLVRVVYPDPEPEPVVGAKTGWGWDNEQERLEEYYRAEEFSKRQGRPVEKKEPTQSSPFEEPNNNIVNGW